MHMFSVLLWVTAAVCLVQGFIVLTKPADRLQSWFYLLVSIANASWAIWIGIFLISNFSNLAGTATTIHYVSSTMVVWAFLILAYSFAESKATKRCLFSGITIIPALYMVFIAISHADLLFSIDYTQRTVKTVITMGVPFAIYYVTYFVASAFIFWRTVTTAKNTLIKQRQRLLFVAYVLAASFGGLFNLILPLLGNWGIIWLGPLADMIFIPIACIAMIRYRLFNVKLYVARILTLGTVFLLLTVGYLLVVSALYASHGVDSAKILINVLVTLIFSAIAYFAFRTAIYITGRRFRGGLLTDDLVYQISFSVLRNIDAHKLLHAAANVMASHMRVSKVSLSVINETSNYFYSTDSQSATLKLTVKQIASCMDEQKIDIIITEELETDSDLYDLLFSQNIAVIARSATLLTTSSVTTYATIKRFPLRIYSDKEIDVLKTIVHVIQIAVDNATYYKQVHEFNKELEIRIADATAGLRATNRKLKRLDATKDDFISIASHQLRTPLTSIKGYISMLIDNDFGHLSAEQKKILGEVYASSERMAFIIDDFLDVSRLQVGKFELQKTPTKLNQILESEISQLKITADSRDIAIEYEMPNGLPVQDLDANKLRQVMMNMIDNAIYYSHGGNNIVVSLYEQRGQIIFTVKDHGIGVPRAEQHKLFTKFYRAPNARKARPDGSGVGLYVARKVIIAHGGSLIFESKEDVGSTFGFRLPIRPLDT